MSAKDLIRKFFLENLGTVVNSEQIRSASGNTTEWARRVRELRGEERWPILTHNDSAALKPGEYLLKEAPPEKKDVAFARSISTKLRAAVLDRNGFTCQMCGLTPGDLDPSTGRKVRLHIGHIVDKSLGGQDVLTNLRALCSTCNEGAKNLTGVKPDAIWLLSQIRRAGMDEQRSVYDWLRTKFEG
jgi:hypothetical protein